MNYEITQELAKSGHQLAALLGTQHGMLDASSLVQRMAGQLDVLIAVLREKTKQCEQVAAQAQITDRIFDNLSADEAEQACGWINAWLEYQMSKGGAA